MPEQAANCAQKPDRVGQMAGRMFAQGSRTKRVIALAGRYGFKICKRHLNTVPFARDRSSASVLVHVACTSVYRGAQSRGDDVSPIEREHGVSANNDPIDDETIAPFVDRMGAGAKPRRPDGVAVLTRSRQNDFRPQRQCRRQRARYGQKMRTIVARHRECRPRASGSRQVSPLIKVPETNAIIMLRTYGAEHQLL